MSYFPLPSSPFSQSPPSSSPPVFTVSQLTHAIKGMLESNFRLVQLEGEISNFKLQTSGHLYFTLKDVDAQISAVMFRMNTTSLPRTPKDGDKVLVSGELSVYAPRGNYQIIIRTLRFSGAGELLLKLEELKQKLGKLGWFAPERKRALPFLPKRIGVITSPTGAVIQDIIHVLSRRYPGFHLILNPVKVQGEGAREEIAKAIIQCNTYQLVDLLIVGRGGGSLEDLWAFNEEIVAHAILMSQIPVISAVGHETDFTIADFVADRRAPTPSAAAELVLPTKESLQLQLTQLQRRMTHTLQLLMQNYLQHLKSLHNHSLFSRSLQYLEPYQQKLDQAEETLILSTLNLIAQKKQALNSIQQKLTLASPSNRLKLSLQKMTQIQGTIELLIRKIISHRQELLLRGQYRQRLELGFRKRYQQEFQKLQSLREKLDVLNPNNLLKKGYAIVFSQKKDSAIVKQASELSYQEEITIRFQDGQVSAVVSSQ
jgi:exodeoxyribonuclease VII large subunit